MSKLLPKLVPLTGHEEPYQVEIFKADLIFRINEDDRFREFTDDDAYRWEPSNIVNHGLAADGQDVANGRSAAQKSRALELMLGIVASYMPIISRNYIVKQSNSFRDIWSKIRVHYDYRKSGSQILAFISPPYTKPLTSESVETYWQRLYDFFEDNLLDPNENILHCGSMVDNKESFQPTLLNTMVVLWLHGIDDRLPQLVFDRYGPELLKNTLFSLREEISSSIKFLLSQGQGGGEDSSISRLNISGQNRLRYQSSMKQCCLCQALKRNANHFLSECKYLPESDKAFMTKKKSQSRSVEVKDILTSEDDSEPISTDQPASSLVRRVGVLAAPVLAACYGTTPVRITIDSGAESDLILLKEAKRLHVPLTPTRQGASQADSITPLNVVGETHFIVTVGHHSLSFNGLVVSELSDPIVGGVPFMDRNDIFVRPKTTSIHIGDCCELKYDPQKMPKKLSSRSVHILRATERITVMPGDDLRLDLPPDFRRDKQLAIEPRLQCPSLSRNSEWLKPSVQLVSQGTIHLHNTSLEPVVVAKSEQVCNIRRMEDVVQCDPKQESLPSPFPAQIPQSRNSTFHSDSVVIGPEVPESIRVQFKTVHRTMDSVFDPNIGCYNGASGRIESVVNTSPALPPQRKGRLPQYSHSDKSLLQDKFDELLAHKILARPEETGISVEYLNPSFLVKKTENRGHRLVTAFGELAKYTKPQPSLLPNVDDTLRTIGQWKYLIKADLRSAYYQIPLSRNSIKFCGVCSPFKGVMVYTRCAMGMPGSETALEEVMSRVLGHLIQTGSVCKISDDLYCGGDSYESVLRTWNHVLQALLDNGLRLSSSKTEICPSACTVLGWIWTSGKLSASPHRISALEACQRPTTVRGMRGFIGAYKFLSRVLPSYSDVLAPLDASVAGLDSKCKLLWTNELEEAFSTAKRHLTQAKSIVLPRASDQLQIITDASQSKLGLAATLFIVRDGVPALAGFFNARMKDHQTRWLPCESEALCIGSAVRHFSPYIVQSSHRTTVLTDSKPCVQAYEKLCRGEFSNSARVMTFLSVLCNYGIELNHIRGKDNLVADFTSRNPIQCSEPSCQICKFVHEADEMVVRAVNIDDVMSERSMDSFTTRTTWHHLQRSCYDLKRTHAHLRQGTVPGRKERNVTDIRRYLNNVQIARDGLLIVQSHLPLAGKRERIVIPRKLIHGLVTAVHLKFNHPRKHQLRQVMHRHFYALNMDDVIDTVTTACDTCKSLQDVPTVFKQQSTSEPVPDAIGRKFAIDVIKRSRQNLLVIREDITSLTLAMLILDETANTIRDAIVQLLSTVRSSSGHTIILRTDPAPAFRSLLNDGVLQQHGIQIQLGNEKNVNKNPVAERCIREIHGQITRVQPAGGPITSTTLAMVVNNVNSVIRGQGLSAFELWTQRDQFKGSQLPISDRSLIQKRYNQRVQSHQPSAKYKARGQTEPNYPNIRVGDLVYLHSDRDKTKARDRYLVHEVLLPNCSVRKFRGRQLRSRSYTVDVGDCISISSNVVLGPNDPLPNSSDSDDSAVLAQSQNSDFSMSDDNDVSIEPDDHIDNIVQTPPARPVRERHPPPRFQDYAMDDEDEDDYD